MFVSDWVAVMGITLYLDNQDASFVTLNVPYVEPLVAIARAANQIII